MSARILFNIFAYKEQEVVCLILLYGCETWPVRVADERMLTDFDKDIIFRILHVRSRDCVLLVELWCHLCLTIIPALLVQRRLRWFGKAARRPDGELMKGLLLPKPPSTGRRPARGQLKTWATTIKAAKEPLSGPRVFGHARWRKDWVNVYSEPKTLVFFLEKSGLNNKLAIDGMQSITQFCSLAVLVKHSQILIHAQFHFL